MKSPAEILIQIGGSARALRLHRNLTQEEVAARADVGARTVQRLETTGRASMEVFVRVAFVLGAEDAFERLFERPSPATIDEVLAVKKGPTRKRARGSR